MPGPWKITSCIIGDKKMYGVYRLIDPTGIDHSGNREMHGGFVDNREEAKATAEKLNKEAN